MFNSYSSLFKSLYSLFEAKEDVVFKKTVMMQVFHSNKYIDEDKVNDFFQENNFNNKRAINNVLAKIKANRQLEYLDATQGREGEIAMSLFSYILKRDNNEMNGVVDDQLKSLKEIDLKHQVLRSENFKFFPFAANFILRVHSEALEFDLMTFIKAVVENWDRVLSSYSQEEIDEFLSMRKDLNHLNFNTVKDWLNLFESLKQFLIKNSLYQNIPNAPLKDFIKGVSYISTLIRFQSSTKQPTESAVYKDGDKLPSGYTIHYCKSSKEVTEATGGPKYVSWCIHDQVTFKGYTGSDGMFLVFTKDNHKSIPENSPDYRLSTLAVSVKEGGRIEDIVSRGNEFSNFTDEDGLFKILGISRSQLDIPKPSYDVIFNIEGTHLVGLKYSKAKRIVIPEGVEHIGEEAFRSNTDIMEVSFPNSLKSIEYAAFEKCTSLLEVHLPDSLSELHDAAFAGCSVLERVRIPGSIEYMGRGAFENCGNLREVVLEEGLKMLRSETFQGCTMLKSTNLPDSLEELGARVFSGTAITELDLPKNLDIVSHELIWEMPWLRKVTLHPDNREFVIEGPFLKYRSDKKVILSLPIESRVLEIPEGTNYFSIWGNYKKVVCPSDWDTIPDRMINGLPNLKEVHFKNPSPSLKNAAVNCCPKLEKITVKGDGIVALGGVRYCKKLKRIDLSPEFHLSRQDAYPFEGCSSLENPLLTKDGKTVVYLLSKGGTATVPEGVENIAESALRVAEFFKDKRKIVYLPKSIKVIKKNAFHEVGAWWIFVCQGELPVIEDSGSEHTVFVVNNTENLPKSDLPVIQGFVEGGLVFEIKGKEAGVVAEISGDTEPTIPKQVNFNNHMYPVTYLRKYAFFQGRISSITLPSTLKKIGFSAFGHSGLRSIDLSNTEVTEIDDFAFDDCGLLKSANLGSSLKSIGEEAFRSTGIKELHLPASLETIGLYAFSEVSSLKKVYVKKWIWGVVLKIFPSDPEIIESSSESQYKDIFKELFNLNYD